ncbi:oligosaccharide flippase family protein [Clostridium bowmanii]|uniref:lipopolysaccharide biosynthesis protein n=1 Tax=Clostridium bowmanii TaxID=132925 RepID=UPI001C0BDDCF|nr:oligosaccharide flippase family protein [Clostridium bowmanii]MBU3191720.1 oligosaccharide flippase family protein [Clostridium bowmanii]MCA1076033.1 oligosaccharide flippase family protein [Clostridium bowmanii]
MEQDSKKFLKSLFGFSVGPIVAAVLAFITVPVTTYFVSPDDFGKAAMYTMGYTLSSMFVFLGLDQAFVREYSESENKNNLFWNSLIFPLIFSIILAFLYVIFYKQTSMLMFDSVEKYIIIILALSLPFAIIDRFNLLVLRMEEKAKVYSFFNILNKLLNIVVLIPYLIFIDSSFKGIINATFISLIIICVVESYFVKHVWKVKFTLDKKLLVKLFKYGIPLVPATVIGWLFSSMDRIALRQWSTFNEIGIYSAAFKIVAVLGIIQSAFCTFWVPTALRWHKEKVSNDKYVQVSDTILAAMVVVFSFIVLFKDVIIRLLSSNYITAAKSVPFLLLFPIMYTISETTTLGISFSRKTYFNIIISLVAALSNYVGNLLLVPKLGSVGASISTGISYIIFFWMRTLISRRLWFKFDLKLYLYNTILMIILSFCSITINNVFINLVIVLLLLFVNRVCLLNIINVVKSFISSKFGKKI